jgi:regulator of protease activity HflC (stomatin/prohibitin superfamily)
MDQLVLTSLRNVIGGLTLDKTLTSREEINSRMRGVLDEVTEKWGVRVNRVELKDIIPPHDVQQAMEKQMQAERNRRAAILLADGQKQSAVLQAEGEKQSAILTAEGQKQAAVLRAEGEAQALVTVQNAQAQAVRLVFSALHESQPNPEILKYLYLQTLPKMAEGSANKVFVVPSELNNIAGIGATLGASMQQDVSAPATPLIPNGNDGR